MASYMWGSVWCDSQGVYTNVVFIPSAVLEVHFNCFVSLKVCVTLSSFFRNFICRGTWKFTRYKQTIILLGDITCRVLRCFLVALLLLGLKTPVLSLQGRSLDQVSTALTEFVASSLTPACSLFDLVNNSCNVPQVASCSTTCTYTVASKQRGVGGATALHTFCGPMGSGTPHPSKSRNFSIVTRSV